MVPTTLASDSIESSFRAALQERLGRNLYEQVAAAHVAILGLGGLGSHAAMNLARNGVGALTLIDFDRVEMSNLHRQQYRLCDLGRYKSDALSEMIRTFNPLVTLHPYAVRLTPDKTISYVAEVDIILECFDDAEEKAWLVRTVRRHFPKKPLITASGMAGLNSANLIHTRQVSHNFYLCGDEVSDVEQEGALICPRVAVCAGHQALLALRLIAGLEESK
ncbi:MAG TPA: sulfur carrier protein ThiS adenylyltransferase ThiF [Clostridiaceae bacterium]|nr:sulfur carrier protein ThiS adenylyltransferase ThiF [Clostridiaceae bacterium]